MLSESAEKLVGNDAFEGYAIDLISEIAAILKFNYTFKWVDDGAYGYKNKDTGEWNGLMGELLSQVGLHGVSAQPDCPESGRETAQNGRNSVIKIGTRFAPPSLSFRNPSPSQKADLAIADLTVNTPRNDAIDFSMPFMKLGRWCAVIDLGVQCSQVWKT